MIKTVSTDHAPAAVGPYSQAAIANGLIFVSGQLALDPATGQFVEGDIAVKTRQVLQNIGAILDAAGAAPCNVLKCEVFLADMADFGAMNEVYAEFFGDHRPARQAIEAARLPKDARIEISCIAVAP